MTEKIDAIGAADAGVGVAIEDEDAARIAELGDGAIVFSSGVEEEIAVGIGVAAAEVLEKRRVQEIPLPDFGVKGSFVVEGEQGEVHRFFWLIVDRGLELKAGGERRRWFAEGFEDSAHIGGLKLPGVAVELGRGPEGRRLGRKMESE